MKQGFKGFAVFIAMLLGGVSHSYSSTKTIGPNPIFLIKAIKKAPAVVYPGQVVTASYSIKNNPINPNTLYGNGLIGLPRGIKVIGGTCARPSFNLSPGKSCTALLQITANQLIGNIRGGPKVCNSLKNPIYCSLPPATSILNIRKDNNPTTARLSVTPTSVSVVQGGSSQEITITNNGPVDAYSVQVKKQPGLGVNISGSCASPLSPTSPNNTCKLTITSGSLAGTTDATIAGRNTNEITERITVIPAAATTLDVSLVSPPPAVISVNGSVGVALSIENKGSNTAYNVVPILPSGWTGVNASTSCGDIEPGQANACTLTFNATKPNIANIIQFKADNSSAASSPYVAFRYEGALVFSVSGTSPNAIAKVVADNDALVGGIRWDADGNCGPFNPCSQLTNAWDANHGQDQPVVPGSTNPNNTGTNGPGNTFQIFSVLNGQNGNTNNPANYAAAACTTYVDGGYTDWYLPAVCEWSNEGNVGYTCSIPNIYANLISLGFITLASDYYWSSTERSGFSASFDAMALNFSSLPPAMSSIPKIATFRIRCVRAISY